ncbi:long-chain fatty acid--CoA ligase [Aeromicrobium halocynthiae]|uniref:Long-chain fatty acid--CoA ligase n=1 Tax=Aeromicrobium halocynthiae TaxID=560557 RepID=A0ABN2VV30_9ACTN
MNNAVDRIFHHAEHTPDHVALRFEDRAWTYAALRDQVVEYAARLEEAGVVPGDRVLLVAPTGPEFVIAYHGLLCAGAVAVTVNAMSTTSEIEYFVSDAGCSLVVAWHEDARAARAAAESLDVPLWVLEPGELELTSGIARRVAPARDDDAVLLYTSGTTGRPKGAQLTHGNLVACAEAVQATIHSSSADRIGTALPLFHVFGQVCVMGAAFHVGASLSLLRPFDGARLLQMAADHRLTILSGVPTMWNAMLHADVEVTREDVSDLRLATSGGAALPLSVAKAFDDRFGCMVLDGYGLSETTGAATFNAPAGERREGSVGPPLTGLSVTVVDPSGEELPPGVVGEVAIRGPVVMKGYWGRPEATAEVMRGDWFLSGDLGRRDEDGYLWIVDRKKDLVIRGGYNVYPREVEEVLYAHPSIREVAVIGLPDDHLGEEVAAVVAPHPGVELSAAEVREWASERLSAYKVPRVYQLVEELPKGATGKILKRQIDRGSVRSHGTHVRRSAV